MQVHEAQRLVEDGLADCGISRARWAWDSRRRSYTILIGDRTMVLAISGINQEGLDARMREIRNAVQMEMAL